jgi:hypothetical protein
MLRSLATTAERLHSKLFNRTPSLCPVCGLFVGTFAGVPVVMDKKKQIIEFVHADCCVAGGR